MIEGLLKRGQEPQVIKEMKRISKRLFENEDGELEYKSGYVMLSGITRPVEITLNLCNNEGKEYTGYIKSLASKEARLRNMALYSIFDQKESLVNFVYNDKYIVEAKAEGVVQRDFKSEYIINQENFMMNYLNMKCSAALAGVGDLHDQNIIISTCEEHKCILIDYDVEEKVNQPREDKFHKEYLKEMCGDINEKGIEFRYAKSPKADYEYYIIGEQSSRNGYYKRKDIEDVLTEYSTIFPEYCKRIRENIAKWSQEVVEKESDEKLVSSVDNVSVNQKYG